MTLPEFWAIIAQFSTVPLLRIWGVSYTTDKGNCFLGCGYAALG